MLYFCSVVKFHPYSTALSAHAGKPFSILSELDCAFDMLLHVVGTAKLYPCRKQQLHHPTLQKQTPCEWKMDRNLLLLFKWCSHSLLSYGAQEEVETYFYPPLAPAPRLLSEELLLYSLEQKGCDSWQASRQLHRSGGSHYFLLPHCSVMLG